MKSAECVASPVCYSVSVLTDESAFNMKTTEGDAITCVTHISLSCGLFVDFSMFFSSSKLKWGICGRTICVDFVGRSEAFAPLWFSHSLYASLSLSDFLHVTIVEGVYSCPMSLWGTLYLQLKKLSSNRYPSISVVQCDCSRKVWLFSVTMGTLPAGQKSTFFVYTSNSEVIHFCLSCTIAWLADPQSSYSWHGDYRFIVYWVSTVIVLELSEIYQITLSINVLGHL